MLAVAVPFAVVVDATHQHQTWLGLTRKTASTVPLVGCTTFTLLIEICGGVVVDDRPRPGAGTEALVGPVRLTKKDSSVSTVSP